MNSKSDGGRYARGYTISRGAVRACAGIVECASDGCELWAGFVLRAEAAVGTNYGGSPEAQAERARLVAAVKLNLVNRREYPFEVLARKYGLPLSLSSFKREKRRFCYELARLCGFV